LRLNGLRWRLRLVLNKLTIRQVKLWKANR
jgi:hypothetical protein